MKNLHFLPALCLAMFLWAACGSADNEQHSSEVEQPSPVEGTWKLTKSKWGDMADFQVPEREIIKIFTKGRVFFIYYDDQKFYGAGGGSYTVQRDSFTETLSYFSWDSTAAGTSQTYRFTIDGSQLHQSGVIKGADIYNNYPVEEYYERLEDGVSTAGEGHPLLGVWRYESGNGNTSEYITTNGLIVHKVFTPKYWHTVFTSAASGVFHGCGFGDYTLEENRYTENLHAFSFDSTAIGDTYQFTMTLAGDRITQIGKIDTEQYPDFTVEEHYRRVE